MPNYLVGTLGFTVIHVLLAAFNEEKALGDVLNSVARTLADGQFKVWVVDDGSTDATAEVAEKWRRQIPLILIHHGFNRGLGEALKTGFSAVVGALIEGDTVVSLDADNTHPPALIPHLVQPIEEGRADIAVASRFVDGARQVGVPLVRRWLSQGASWLFRLCLPVAGLKDYTCGFRAYRAALLKRAVAALGPTEGFPLISEPGFAATAELITRLSAFHPRVIEVPLTLRYDRKPGASKMPLWRTMRRNTALLFRLRRKWGVAS